MSFAIGMALTSILRRRRSRVCTDRMAWARLSHILGMLRGSLEPVASKAIVSAMTDVVGTFFRSKHVQGASDEIPGGIDGPGLGLPQQFFEYGECHLNRIEIGAVGRQEQ